MPSDPFLPVTSISQLVSEQAGLRADAPAILSPRRAAMTYGALWQHVQDTVAKLCALGVTPASRVAVVLPNGPEMAAAFLGVSACATCAPLNPTYQAAELRFYLEDIRAQFVLVGKGERGAARTVADDLGLTVIEVETRPLLPAGRFAFDLSPNIARAPAVFSAADDVALILHTSGTTARPKIVPLSHANLIASARNIARGLALQPADRCLNVMPLFHIHGLVGALLASMSCGSSIVCALGFDDHAFFDWIADEEPTWYTAVPTIHHAVVSQGARYRHVAPNHQFRFVRSSSSALPPKIFESLESLFDAPVVEAYGMTEASHEVASNPLSGQRKAGSVGFPTGAEVAMVDESGRFVPAGAFGEIVIRGPGVTAGYESSSDVTGEAFYADWFRTGDQGRFDDEGYLHISGRLKEIINRGGEKISPREIDEALLEHADVLHAVAFGVPHPTLGETVVAATVLRDGATVDESGLQGFLLERLAQFKVPSRVMFVDAIPKGPTGKVRRTELHARFTDRIAKVNVEPLTDPERAIAETWKRLLHIDGVSATDNFFDLGGDSLLATRAVIDIEKHLGVRLDARRLVVESLGQLALSATVGTVRPRPVPIKRTGWQGRLRRLRGQ
jgi:oxalate---CoA ligase